MKKTYLLLVLLVSISSCQKEEISSPIIDGTPQEGAVQNIDFKDLPGPILQNFDDNHFIKHETKRKGLAIGKANTNIPAVKVKNKQGKATYTIAISKSKKTKSSLLYFDNYVVKELQDGSQKKFIMRYLPSQDWYYQKNRDLKNYSGKIKIYDMEGNISGNMLLEHGAPISQDAVKLNDVLECNYSFKSMLCTDLIMQGDESGGAALHLHIFFRQLFLDRWRGRYYWR